MQETVADFIPENPGFCTLMDCAIELTRDAASWLLPAYILANAPVALGLIVALTGIGTRNVRMVAVAACLIAGGLLLRWWMHSLMQRRLLRRLAVRAGAGSAKRIWAVILTKLILVTLGLWGAMFFLVPTIASLISSAVAAPFIWDQRTTDFSTLRRIIVAPYKSTGLLMGAALLGGLYLLLGGLLYALITMIVDLLIPSFLGIPDLYYQLLIRSRSFLLGLWIISLIPLDVLWLSAGVILSRQLELRGSGADIHARLLALAKAYK